MTIRNRLPRTIVAIAVAAAALAACSSDKKSDSAAKSPSAATSPLTGKPAAVGVDVDRKALAVKIDNTNLGRPQWGVSSADLVVEEVVEGGLTRIMAVFQSQNADKIGPIRSVRPVDPKLAKSLGDAALVYSGGQDKVLSLVQESGLDVVNPDNEPNIFMRDPTRQMPYNLYSTTADIYGALTTSTGPPGKLGSFDVKAPEPTGPGRTAGAAVTVVMTGVWTDDWVYDVGAGSYELLHDGTPAADAEGVPEQFSNLVFQQVDEVATGLVDENDDPVPSWGIDGSGPAWVARDGVLIQGSWAKSGDDSWARLSDSAHDEIDLKPGSTWWVLLPSEGGSVQGAASNASAGG